MSAAFVLKSFPAGSQPYTGSFGAAYSFTSNLLSPSPKGSCSGSTDHGRPTKGVMSSSLRQDAMALIPTLCMVCGDHASGKHYGVLSCDGCRGFFKRSIRRNQQYVCKEQGSCVVDVARRNQCQACRFNKCLKVNMNRDAVQSERATRKHPYACPRTTSPLEPDHKRAGCYDMYNSQEKIQETSIKYPNQHYREARAIGVIRPQPRKPTVARASVSQATDDQPFHSGPIGSQATSVVRERRLPLPSNFSSPRDHRAMLAMQPVLSKEALQYQGLHHIMIPQLPPDILASFPALMYGGYGAPHVVPHNPFLQNSGLMIPVRHKPDTPQKQNVPNYDYIRHLKDRHCAYPHIEHAQKCSTTSEPASQTRSPHATERLESVALKLLIMSVRWARELPSFRTLSAADQGVLLEQAWEELLILNAAQCNVNLTPVDGSSSLPLMDEEQLLHDAFTRIQNLNTDPTEYACLKTVVIFKADAKGVRDVEAVEHHQDQAQLMFSDYVHHVYSTQKCRFGKLLLLLPSIRTITSHFLAHHLFPNSLRHSGSMKKLLSNVLNSKY